MRVKKVKTCVCGGVSCDLEKNYCYNEIANKHGASSGSVCIYQTISELNDWNIEGAYITPITATMKICPGAGICDQGNYCVKAPVLPSSVPDCGDPTVTIKSPCAKCGGAAGPDCLPH